MLATSLQGLPAMTTTANLPAQSFPGKPPLYPSFPNTSFLAPFSGYPAMPNTYAYGGGCNGTGSLLPHLSTSTAAFSALHPTANFNYSEMNGHSTNGLISSKNSHSIEGQLSPQSVEDSHHNRGRVTSTDGSISPVPTSSPPARPLLSPDTSSHPSSLTTSHLPSLPSSHIPKTTYNLSTNGLSTNGFGYGSSASTQHHLPQNSLSHAPSTLSSSLFNPPYTNLNSPITPLPAAVPNVVMYPSHPAQVDYNSPSAISSSMNLWGQYPNAMHKLSYDTPRYKLTPERATPLQKWFDDHKDHPYPTRHDKILLCQDTSLTFTQVSTWFANCRRRLKKANQEEEERNYSGSGSSSSNSNYQDDSCAQSPGCDSLGSGSHDSDDKMHDYGPVTPTSLHAEEFTVNCTYNNSTQKH